MSLALRKLVTSETQVLRPGELIRAAGRGRSVKGTDSAKHFPASTIWAVSNQRLFVFANRERGGGALAQPIVALELGTVVTGARTDPFDNHDVLLVVEAAGHPAMVLMNPDDAQEIVDEIISVPIAEPLDREEATIPVPTNAPRSPDEPSERPTFATQRVHLDPTEGNVELAAIRASLEQGDWAPLKSALGPGQDPQAREWISQHLWGDALADGIDQWVDAEPECAEAYLARGANRATSAEIHFRDGGSSEDLSAALIGAEHDLLRSVELHFDDAVPFTFLLRSGASLEIPFEELCMRFDESIRRSPNLPGAHFAMLEALSPFGAGSEADMFAFAQTTSRASPEGSPLHALVPFAHLLASEGQYLAGTHRRYFTGAVLSEIDLFASMGIENAAWRDVPGSGAAANIFAAALARCEQISRAQSVATRPGFARTYRPWSLLHDGNDLFASLNLSQSVVNFRP